MANSRSIILDAKRLDGNRIGTLSQAAWPAEVRMLQWKMQRPFRGKRVADATGFPSSCLVCLRGLLRNAAIDTISMSNSQELLWFIDYHGFKRITTRFPDQLLESPDVTIGLRIIDIANWTHLVLAGPLEEVDQD